MKGAPEIIPAQTHHFIEQEPTPQGNLLTSENFRPWIKTRDTPPGDPAAQATPEVGAIPSKKAMN